MLKCCDNIKYLKTVKDVYFDLIITSPPFNIGKEYENKKTIKNYLQEMSNVIVECDRVLAKTGAIIWQVGNYVDKGSIVPLDIYFLPIFLNLGYKLRNRIVLSSNFGMHCKNRLSGRYETALWLTKSDKYTFNLDSLRIPQLYPNKTAYRGPNKGELSGNPLGKNPGDFWPIVPVRNNHPEWEPHPCQFPLELCIKWIEGFSNPDEKVFDPFCGVGSVVLASMIAGRQGYGVDREKKYIDIAKSRVKRLQTTGLSVRLNGETKEVKVK